MRVRAPECGYASVKIMRHCELFARRLGVKIAENYLCPVLLCALYYPVRLKKRIFRAEAHSAPSDEVHYAHASKRRIEHAPAASRILRRVICRTQDIPAVVEIVRYPLTSEGVVAESYNVGAGVKYLLRLGRRYAYPRRVFSVNNGKRRAVQLL